MSNTSRGLPLSRSRVEQIFPILTPAQINRIAVHGIWMEDVICLKITNIYHIDY